ncbi:MAG: pyridoxal phosphate-dependent aminotransferase [Erysipelotrichaceae bacterium]|nr:pyridoxal phosphate-dependent aminotransferase [Erysipelotrichaceae bacterium]MDD4642872.1 pyridoxal phosphate-dependent aminotransferase [Erysipelotrichaceae bacterium]
MKYDFETLVDRREHCASKWMKMYRQNPDVPACIVPLSVADMEFKNAPEIVEGLKKVLDEQIMGYTGCDDGYYNAIINWMKRRHDLTIEKDWIITTPGIVLGINFILKALSKPNDGVIIFTPSYYPFFDVIKKNDLIVKESELKINDGHYRIDFDDLSLKASDPNNKIMILCSPFNPVGRVWTKEELINVAEICLANDIVLIVDEIHHDIIMPGFHHYSLGALDDRYMDKIITCTSCSKSFNLAGLQGSNIFIKDKIMRNKVKTELYKVCINSLNIFAYNGIRIAYDEAEAWLDECIEVIYQNSLFLKDFINKNLPMLKVYPLEGTYLQWIDCKALNLSKEVLEQKMIEHDLYLDEGYIFGECGAGFERINLACPRSVLADALERLKALVMELGS